MNRLRLFSLSATAALLFYGCTGPQGEAGTTGINGTNGTNGTNGFANVSIKTDSITITGWRQVGTPNANGYCDTLADGGIADTTYDVVEVYYSTLSRSGPWTALPVSDVYYSPPNDTLDQLGYTWGLGYVKINYKILLPGYTILPKSTIYLDIAAIPPAFIKRHPATNWKDAGAVLRLPEIEAAMQGAAR